MKYTVLFGYDWNNRERGLFMQQSSIGPIVVIFSNSTNLKAFVELASKTAAKDGGKIAGIEIMARSVQEVEEQLKKSNPTITDSVNFVSNDDPIFEQLLAALRD